MSTLIRENKPSRGLLRSNPVLSRLSKITERSQDNAATYAGIARKTSFFLLMTLVGLVAQLVVMFSTELLLFLRLFMTSF